MRTLNERYETVLERIAQAAQRVGRNPADITLVAVTKTWPGATVLAAHEAGMRHFGENRAEELAEKRPLVSKTLPPGSDITWHLIGTLQSRKTKLAAEHADVFHALERLKIARRLSEQRAQFGAPLPVLLEVNVSGEMSKSGVNVQEWESCATHQENVRSVVQSILDKPGIHLQGLMTMAPWGVSPAEIRAVFRRTRLLAEWLETAVDHLNLSTLSMGMTDDFEIAIEEGATHVRIGRAIFGQRE